MEDTLCITKKHTHSFHTNCSRPKCCRLARHFSLTTKPTEPSERNTWKRELPASVCSCVCVFMCAKCVPSQWNSMSKQLSGWGGAREESSAGGKQLAFFFFPPLNFSPCSFFSPLFWTLALHTLDPGCHIPHCVSEGASVCVCACMCVALCSALSAMYNCSGVLLLCQECSHTHSPGTHQHTKQHRWHTFDN